MTCACTIVPKSVLERLAVDRRFPARARQAAANSARVSDELRLLRTQALSLTRTTHAAGARLLTLAAAPELLVYDCRHTQSLPGRLVAKPKTARDSTVKRAWTATGAVATFYRQVFRRNSIDGAGMTLASSVHYGVDFNNAMWNGSQMVYGDGDGRIFLDFTRGIDVIGHELTHGVTQHTLQLDYSGDAGGLNESLSDCFGAMFQQWQSGQDVHAASWLIGAQIMGPAAKAKGYTCLRNMSDPADVRCLAPQPTRYGDITPGTDPHYSSGPPNLAFCRACKSAGGRSWETVGPVWYAAMTTGGPQPQLTMPQFAARTRQAARQLYGARSAIVAAVDDGWTSVGL